MINKSNNMGDHLIDLKAWAACLAFYGISFANASIIMQIISFIFAIAFTARRWWLMEKRNNKDTEI
jgi:hypothetical protein